LFVGSFGVSVGLISTTPNTAVTDSIYPFLPPPNGWQSKALELQGAAGKVADVFLRIENTLRDEVCAHYQPFVVVGNWPTG
jgi:hypothetical protein